MKKVTSFVTTLALLVWVASPLSVLADPPHLYSINIDSINGNPPSTACIASPITVVGSGTVTNGQGSGPSQYHIQLVFSNGLATTTINGIAISTTTAVTNGGKNFGYRYSTTTSAVVATATTIKARIYHAGVPGNDGQADKVVTISVCVAPPTTAALNITKTVENSGGGTAAASDFTLHLKSSTTTNDVVGSPFPGSSTGTGFVLGPGTYILSENPMATYSGSISGQCSSGGTITVVAGQTYSCTITNTFNVTPPSPPTLTLVKTVVNDNGGTKQVSDFVLKVDGSQVTSGVSTTTVAGLHTASEVNLPGYTASVWGGDCASDGTITLANGENKTCTITNDDQPSHVLVKKHVVNTHGGTKVASDFNITVTDNSGTPSPAQFQGSESGVDVTLNAGNYSVDEEIPSGYSVTYSDGDGLQCGGMIGNGESRVCTILNEDISPTLTVIKSVTNNDGGTKQVADFGLFVGTTQVLSGVQTPFNAGGYTVSETNANGYQATFGGDCDSSGFVTLGLGENKTCTITNDDVFVPPPPTEDTLQLCSDGVDNDNDELVDLADPDCASFTPQLTVTKVIINDDGGQKQVSDFPLFVDSGSVSSGVQASYTPGAHVVSETSSSGYAATFSGDCDENGNVTLAIGDVKTCTITNNDIQPKLTVTKVVINDSGTGESQVSDFTLRVGEAQVTSGAQNGFNAGTYTVSEQGPSGYTATFSGDCNVDGVVSLAPGDVKTCTITNDDNPSTSGTLRVIKLVTNDNGGTAVSSDFTIHVRDGESDIAGSPASGDAEGRFYTLTAGSYSVSEDTVSGYSGTFSGDCNADGNVSVIPGQTATCTITNDDLPSHVLVITHVVNNYGGTKVASDFNNTVTDSNGTSTPSTFAGSETGVDVTLNAGNFSIEEAAIPGYMTVTYSGVESCGGIIGNGENLVCTIIREDQPGADLALTKTVDQSSPVTGQQVTFTLKVTNGGPQDALSVVVTDALPAGLSFVSASSSAGVYSTSTNQWLVGNMLNGQSQTLQLVATVTASQGTIVNQASVAMDPNLIDPFSANNTAQASLTLSAAATDVCPNLDGNQQSVPSGRHLDNGQCVADSNGGGGGGGGGGNGPLGSIGGNGPLGGSSGNTGGGLVLGAEIGPILNQCDTLDPYLTSYLKLGGNNNSADVTRLQQFLNSSMGENLPVTGFFGPLTFEAVKRFQERWNVAILVPWANVGLPTNGPTGYVYKTTKRWINILNCPLLIQNTPIPSLP